MRHRISAHDPIPFLYFKMMLQTLFADNMLAGQSQKGDFGFTKILFKKKKTRKKKIMQSCLAVVKKDFIMGFSEKSHNSNLFWARLQLSSNSFLDLFLLIKNHVLLG